jgi:hypothetical protein
MPLSAPAAAPPPRPHLSTGFTLADLPDGPLFAVLR